MNSVAIVGAGITGLTAAYRLGELGIPVTVYEAAPRVGGVVRTMERDGFLAESGPNTILETSPSIGGLVRDLGLEPERVYSAPAASNRYILREGSPTAVPGSLLAFLKSRLFSRSAKLRMAAELFVRRAGEGGEESVAAFVRRRLGDEFLDYAINPMVAGIYAGDPARLSVRHAFPRLHALEQRYGSLLLGQVLGGRERRKRREAPKASAPKFSFAHGLQTLAGALHKPLRGAVRLGSPVRAIRRTGTGWEVLCGQGCGGGSHAALLLSAPAHKLADLVLEGDAPFVGRPFALLGKIPYAPVASLVLGFRREAVAHPLDGFGVLVPEAERRNILGVIFSSSLFPNRAPKGHVTLTSYLGGMRSPALATEEGDAALALVLKDLRAILGVGGAPAFVHHTVFPKAIPQYEIGFGRFREFMNQLEVSLPGLHFAGHFRDGISLGDSIASGDAAAKSLAAFLRSRESQTRRTPSRP